MPILPHIKYLNIGYLPGAAQLQLHLEYQHHSVGRRGVCPCQRSIDAQVTDCEDLAIFYRPQFEALRAVIAGARTTAALTKKICIFLKTAPLADTTSIGGGWQLTRRAACAGVSAGRQPLAESRGGATSRVARFFQSQQQQLVALISLAVRGLNSDGPRHASSADN